MTGWFHLSFKKKNCACGNLDVKLYIYIFIEESVAGQTKLVTMIIEGERN